MEQVNQKLCRRQSMEEVANRDFQIQRARIFLKLPNSCQLGTRNDHKWCDKYNTLQHISSGEREPANMLKYDLIGGQWHLSFWDRCYWVCRPYWVCHFRNYSVVYIQVSSLLDLFRCLKIGFYCYLRQPKISVISVQGRQVWHWICRRPTPFWNDSQKSSD